MANRYWIGRSVDGDWFSTSNWSSTSNGSGGASVPTSSDDVFFDQYSFNASGQGVTTGNVASYCRSINWTGATNTPKFSFAALYVSGSLTFIAQMKFAGLYNNECSVFFVATSGTYTINMPSSFLWTSASPDPYFRSRTYIQCSGNATYNLAAHLYSYDFAVYNGVFNTNNYNITASTYLAFADYVYGYDIPTPYVVTINLGTSTVSGGQTLILGSDRISLTANQATLVLQYATILTGNNIGTLTFFTPGTGLYGSLGGTFSVNVLNIPPEVIRITFDTGANITLNTLTATGTSSRRITLQPTTAGQTWTLSCSSGVKTCNYLALSGSQATGGAIWNAGYGSIDNGSNTGWLFPGKSNGVLFGTAF